jgi:uncharacterized damage-inducible protein DinB
MNQLERVELLWQYENGPQLLADALTQFPRAMWTYQPGENKWSIHEVIIHLADSASSLVTSS